MPKPDKKQAAKSTETNTDGTPTPAETPMPDLSAIKIPHGAAVWGLKLEQDGAWERCRFYEAGEARDRWLLTDLPTIERIGRTWGRGRYKLLFLSADAVNKGTSREIAIDDPRLPPGRPYPNKPSETSGAPSSTSPYGTDRSARILEIAEGKLDPARSAVLLFSLLEEGNQRHQLDADRRANAEIDRMRERARIERDEDERRHKARLDEEEARWKRRIAEEQADRQAERERRRAQEEEDEPAAVTELREQLARLEEEREEGGGKSDVLSTKLVGLIDTITPHAPAAIKFVWDAIGEKAAKNKANNAT